MTTPDDPDIGFYDRHQIRQLTTLSTVTLWRLERAGKFPKSMQLSANRVAWPRAAVHAWLREKEAADAATC